MTVRPFFGAIPPPPELRLAVTTDSRSIIEAQLVLAAWSAAAADARSCGRRRRGCRPDLTGTHLRVGHLILLGFSSGGNFGSGN